MAMATRNAVPPVVVGTWKPRVLAYVRGRLEVPDFVPEHKHHLW